MQNRALARLTTTEIARLDKDRIVIVQPIGATEQHGPHLPCDTDVLIVTGLLDAVLQAIGDKTDVWVLPVLSYGKSNEHVGYPGTISLSAQTLMSVCLDMGRAIADSGFHRLVLLNGHGGQPQLLEMVARDIRAETGLLVFPLFPFKRRPPSEWLSSTEEARYGIHGGELETALVMALEPHAVRTEVLAAGGLTIRERLAYLDLDGDSPVAWLTRDLSTNGVIGDPARASQQLGSRLVHFYVDHVAAVLREIAQFDFAV